MADKNIKIKKYFIKQFSAVRQINLRLIKMYDNYFIVQSQGRGDNIEGEEVKPLKISDNFLTNNIVFLLFFD